MKESNLNDNRTSKKLKTDVRKISQEEIDGLLERLESHTINPEDYELLKQLIETVINLNHELEKKNASIKRLRRLFNIKTEKLKHCCPKRENKEEKNNHDNKDNGPSGKCGSDSSGDEKKDKKKKGHGRIGADQYKNAQRVRISHDSLKPGSPCPACDKGKLYASIKPGIFVRITASPPFVATIYEQEKLRCNTCGKIFTAALPEDAAKEKYDESVSAMLAMLKYGSGLPFNRIGKLQKNCKVPFPLATQWDQLKEAAEILIPIHSHLVYLAAQGNVIYNDDTSMRILSLMKENENKKDGDRKGIFSTGIISEVEGNLIVLYFTGRNHSGENISAVLAGREKSRCPPIQMCDAASTNSSHDIKVLLANCLSHGRRQFVDIIDNFPYECEYVLELLSKVYKNNEKAKKEHLSPDERLLLHQTHSGPLMNKLKSWIETKLENREVEPNSGLGQAFGYLLRHWEPLTLFLRKPGAPLDNNIIERALKKVILHRKNSLFYKTINGARVGDIFMSLIETCLLAKVNVLAYLTVILENIAAVRKDPSAWMPWNYETALAGCGI
jgi:transposase